MGCHKAGYHLVFTDWKMPTFVFGRNCLFPGLCKIYMCTSTWVFHQHKDARNSRESWPGVCRCWGARQWHCGFGTRFSRKGDASSRLNHEESCLHLPETERKPVSTKWEWSMHWFWIRVQTELGSQEPKFKTQHDWFFLRKWPTKIFWGARTRHLNFKFSRKVSMRPCTWMLHSQKG